MESFCEEHMFIESEKGSFAHPQIRRQFLPSSVLFPQVPHFTRLAHLGQDCTSRIMGNKVCTASAVGTSATDAVWSVDSRGRRLCVTCIAANDTFMSAHNTSPPALTLLSSFTPTSPSPT